MILKGIMDPLDARHALDSGADALIVSNHGGRQLDGAPATLEVLPTIVAEVGHRISFLWMVVSVRARMFIKRLRWAQRLVS